MSDATRIGEQMGDFLRGFLRAPAPDAPQPSGTVPPRKWAVVDANETATGVMVSLTLDLDHPEPFGQLTRDQEANGLVHFASGISTPLNVVIAKDYANAISLLPDPNSRNWNLVANGDVQPFGKLPYQVTFFEETIPETDVVRVGGHIFDPNTQQRVNFSITHDPIETVILAIVAGLAALICGGVVLGAEIFNRGQAQAVEQCGEGGIKKLTIKRKYGFSWKKGGPDIGCGEDYIIECNPPPRPPNLPPGSPRSDPSRRPRARSGSPPAAPASLLSPRAG